MSRWIRIAGALPLVAAVVLSATCSEEEGETCCECRCCERTATLEREEPWADCPTACSEFCQDKIGCSEAPDHAAPCGSGGASAQGGAGGAGAQGGDVPDASYDGPPLFPQDGHWSGVGISFSVSGGGTLMAITLADYGTCTVDDCYASDSTTCGNCETPITAMPGHAVFEDVTLGCSGIFDSDITAYGTCQKLDEQCQCTLSRSWTATR